MTVIPSGAAPKRFADPSSSNRGSPSVIARCASLMTAGSAHAPPIQPWTCPAAVTMAREPSCPDDGPCRQTTVASANSSPRRASSLACSTTSQLSTSRPT